MPLGCPCAGRISFVNVTLQQQRHQSWMEAKRYFQMSSDDELANCLLELATHSTVSSEVSIVPIICLCT